MGEINKHKWKIISRMCCFFIQKEVGVVLCSQIQAMQNILLTSQIFNEIIKWFNNGKAFYRKRFR